MIRVSPSVKSAPPAWHDGFMAMLPQILVYARYAFRHLDPEGKQEAVQSVVAGALAAYVRLVQRGKQSIAYAQPLAKFAIRQFNDGRNLGNRLSIRDVSSRYCQQRKGVTVERLDRFDTEENSWREAVVEDTHTPVFDQVWFRIDFPAWLVSLTRRHLRIAKALLLGHRTRDVAKRFDLSSARISQLRRELHRSWQEFQHEQLVEEQPRESQNADMELAAA